MKIWLFEKFSRGLINLTKQRLEEVAAAGFPAFGRPGLSNLLKRPTTFIYFLGYKSIPKN